MTESTDRIVPPTRIEDISDELLIDLVCPAREAEGDVGNVLRAELLRRLTAAERPAEGTVTAISPAEQLLRVSVRLFDCLTEFDDDRSCCQRYSELWDDAVISYKNALAASSAPADAALGHGEGTE